MAIIKATNSTNPPKRSGYWVKHIDSANPQPLSFPRTLNEANAFKNHFENNLSKNQLIKVLIRYFDVAFGKDVPEFTIVTTNLFKTEHISTLLSFLGSFLLEYTKDPRDNYTVLIDFHLSKKIDLSAVLETQTQLAEKILSFTDKQIKIHGMAEYARKQKAGAAKEGEVISIKKLPQRRGGPYSVRHFG